MPAKKFDLCLKNLLTISGVTCEELAQHLGVTVPVVRRWMSGSFPDAEELAELLGLNLDTLEGLLLLAETENEDILEPLDDAIYAIVSSFQAILEGAK